MSQRVLPSPLTSTNERCSGAAKGCIAVKWREMLSRIAARTLGPSEPGASSGVIDGEATEAVTTVSPALNGWRLVAAFGWRAADCTAAAGESRGRWPSEP